MRGTQPGGSYQTNFKRQYRPCWRSILIPPPGAFVLYTRFFPHVFMYELQWVNSLRYACSQGRNA